MKGDLHWSDLAQQNSEGCKRAIAWQSEQPYSREDALAQVQRLKEGVVTESK